MDEELKALTNFRLRVRPLVIRLFAEVDETDEQGNVRLTLGKDQVDAIKAAYLDWIDVIGTKE